MYLCTCTAAGCGDDEHWSDIQAQYVRGAWVSKAIYFRHRRVDQERIALEEQQQMEEVNKSAVLNRTLSNSAPSPGENVKLNASPPRNTDRLDHHPQVEVHRQTQNQTTIRDDTRRLEEALLDLRHISTFLDQRCLSFSVTGPLSFAQSPGKSSSACSHYPTEFTNANVGPLKLLPSASENASILAHEDHMFRVLLALETADEFPSLATGCTLVMERAQDELKRITKIKASEWNRQVAAAKEKFSVRSSSSDGVLGPVRVNSDSYHRHQLAGVDPAAIGCYFLVMVLSLMCGLSNDHCNFVLAVLRGIISQFIKGNVPSSFEEASLSIPKDCRTLFNLVDLDPHLRSFVCCPTCFALYDESRPYPERCSYQALSDESPCSAKLTRTRTIRGQEFQRPIRKFLYQDMKHWVARLLARPDIERMLEQKIPAPSPNRGDEVNDIWEAAAVLALMGPDGKPFTEACSGDVRLLFALGVDGFNPFGMKPARGSATVTGIYMVCLNLPPDLRYLPENMFLVGVIPGPNKPSSDQINHCLEPLIDDLLEFWFRGVHFSRTALHLFGRSALAALIPVVCDVQGARQVGGFLAHSANLFCSFCYLKLHQIENFDIKKWPIRTAETHRRHAEAWRDAVTAEEKESLLKENGVRYSELLRLPYWNPILFTVLDTMHAHFLRNLPEHIREIWGIDPTGECGEGFTSPTNTPPAIPTPTELIGGLEKLKKGLHDEAHIKKLASLRRSVLWHLCKQFDLRRAGVNLMLAEALIRWHRAPDAKVQLEKYLEILREKADDGDGELPSESEPEILETETEIETETNVTDSEVTDTDQESVTCIGGKPVPPKPRVGASTARTRTAELKRKNPSRPPSVNELAQAKHKLRNASSTKAIGAGVRVPTLRALCTELGINFAPPSGSKKPLKKEALLELLAQWRASEGIVDENGALIAPRKRSTQKTKSESAGSTVVLGRAILEQIWEDQSILELPSFISPVPWPIGLEKRKLSADQWRSAGLIHLVITLIRLWGFETGRKGEMLVNYMHLITAIHIAHSRVTSSLHAENYTFHYKIYLEGVSTLYREAKFQPTHHLSLHLEQLLNELGPVHSWRAWAFERFNYMLQRTKTNLRFGELELTFMNDACRAANVPPLLSSSHVPGVMKDIWPAFLKTFRADIRGTRINDILAFGTSGKLKVAVAPNKMTGKQAEENKKQLRLAMEHVQTKNPRDIIFCSKIQREGVIYQTSSRSPKDANIVVLDTKGNEVPSLLLAFFLYKASPKADHQLYIVHTRYVALQGPELSLDPYRRFGWPVAGALFRDLCHPPEVTSVGKLVTLFAKSRYNHGRLGKIIHALPIKKVVHMDPYDVDFNEDDDEMEEMEVVF